MFTNMIRTDGYGVDFILAGPKNQAATLPDPDLSDFDVDELANTFHLWGQTEIFTASDGHTDDAHQIRRYSTDEYYTFAGYKKTNKRILNVKAADANLTRAEQQIRSYENSKPR